MSTYMSSMFLRKVGAVLQTTVVFGSKKGPKGSPGVAPGASPSRRSQSVQRALEDDG